MEQKKPKTNKSGEIELIEVLHYLWIDRRLIFKITVGFFFLGILFALTSQRRYEVDAQLLPEDGSNTEASSLLRQFGGLGGLNIPFNEDSDAIRPDLYPLVLNSKPFYIDLINSTVDFKTKEGIKQITVFEYMDQHTTSFWGTVKEYTIGLPSKIIRLFKRNKLSEIEESQTIPILTDKQSEIIKELEDCIYSEIDQRNGIITISVVLPNAYVASQMGQFSVDYISNYITEYRTEKTNKNLKFIEERYAEKKYEFEKAQNNLAQFRDENRNVQSATVMAEEQRLQQKFTLAFNIYNELAQQLEQAKIKVQEETPVIKIIEPVYIPLKPSLPKKGMLVALNTFLGIIIGIGFVLGRIGFKNLLIKFKNYQA